MDCVLIPYAVWLQAYRSQKRADVLRYAALGFNAAAADDLQRIGGMAGTW